MLCSKSEFADAQYLVSVKRHSLSITAVRLSGTSLTGEHTPIKLFHKALAQWTPKPNLIVHPRPAHCGGVSCQCFFQAKSQIQWPPNYRGCRK